MSFYEDNPEKLKEDIQLARDYGITISDADLNWFFKHLLDRRSAEIQQWRRRQIDLDSPN